MKRRGVELGAEADVGHHAARIAIAGEREEPRRDARVEFAARGGIERVARRQDALAYLGFLRRWRIVNGKW